MVSDSKISANNSWGRYSHSKSALDKYISFITTFLILTCCPFLVVYYWSSLTYFGCNIIQPISLIYFKGIKYFLKHYGPKFELSAMYALLSWYIFQIILYISLPGKITKGQITPAGNLPIYKVNGLFAWIISHILFIVFSIFYPNIFNPLFYIADNWGGLLIASNILAYALSLFVYIKAYVWPNHPEDRKFSDSSLYDFYMGIEFNPRITEAFDFKLFHNGRPGIIAWTLINASFAAYQFRKFGTVSDSMILVNILQGIYAVDLFVNEDWYLRTIDIAHDHFGFYLAWGDLVWLPFMYTLQAQYLSRNLVVLGPYKFYILLALGLLGYTIFRLTNNQKDQFRLAFTAGKPYYIRYLGGLIGASSKPATYVPTKYSTSDGAIHHSALLTSGFWGVARHFNYTGDIILASCMCLACGPITQALYPYFYIAFMLTLLINRVYRDEERCSQKYGKYWEDYCRKVPYRLIPYIY